MISLVKQLIDRLSQNLQELEGLASGPTGQILADDSPPTGPYPTQWCLGVIRTDLSKLNGVLATLHRIRTELDNDNSKVSVQRMLLHRR